MSAPIFLSDSLLNLGLLLLPGQGCQQCIEGDPKVKQLIWHRCGLRQLLLLGQSRKGRKSLSGAF